MLTALGSPVSSHNGPGHYCSEADSLQISDDNTHGNAIATNLFNLNFKEFKLSLPIPASIKSGPTVLSSDLLDLPSALSASLAVPSSSTTMASPKSSKKTTNPPGSSGTASTGGSSVSTPAAQPQPLPNLLNKSAGSSTGIYQQSVLLRSRLQRLPSFAQFLEFSHSGPRATRDVVHQLWETFALGKPLCILFNLQDIPPTSKISEYADDIVDPDPLRKERQRAIALFIMGANNLKNVGFWEKDAPLFSISELIGDVMDTNGFVKVVATVLYLLDKLPSTVWSDQVETLCANAISSHEPVSSLTSRADVERANLVRELIETERKYCQDLEIMQVGYLFPQSAIFC
jgi:cell division control protein 24